jgi:hypothetical protein
VPITPSASCHAVWVRVISKAEPPMPKYTSIIARRPQKPPSHPEGKDPMPNITKAPVVQGMGVSHRPIPNSRAMVAAAVAKTSSIRSIAWAMFIKSEVIREFITDYDVVALNALAPLLRCL